MNVYSSRVVGVGFVSAIYTAVYFFSPVEKFGSKFAKRVYLVADSSNYGHQEREKDACSFVVGRFFQRNF